MTTMTTNDFWKSVFWIETRRLKQLGYGPALREMNRGSFYLLSFALAPFLMSPLKPGGSHYWSIIAAMIDLLLIFPGRAFVLWMTTKDVRIQVRTLQWLVSIPLIAVAGAIAVGIYLCIELNNLDYLAGDFGMLAVLSILLRRWKDGVYCRPLGLIDFVLAIGCIAIFARTGGPFSAINVALCLLFSVYLLTRGSARSAPALPSHQG